MQKIKMKVRRALGYIQVASLRSANPSARQNKQNEKSKIRVAEDVDPYGVLRCYWVAKL